MFPDCRSIVVSSWCHLVLTLTDREADDYSEDLLNSTQTINIICPLSTVDFVLILKSSKS